MRYIIILSLLFISSIASAQLVRIDSTTTAKRIYYYNQAGLYIGSDSVNEKVVRATLDGGDTFKIPTYTLIQRDPEKFYTIDSLAPYLKINDLDEKVEDKIGAKLVEGTGITITYNDGTGETTLDASAASGLNTEAVFDSIGYYLKEKTDGGIKITDYDSGDSLTIEGKFKELNENLIWDTDGQYCIWNGSSQINATATWGCHFTVVGTVTAPSIATTSRFTSARRSELIATTSTTSVAGLRETSTTFTLGNMARQGGFTYKCIWGPATGLTSNSNYRGFCGMASGASNPTDVDPSTLTNMFGMAWDDDDTNIQFMHNDGSGTATKVDLGSNFPVPTTDRTDIYKLEMYALPNSSTVYYKVTDINDETSVSGSVNTNLPASTGFFGPRLYTSVGGTSAAAGVAIIKLIIKSNGW